MTLSAMHADITSLTVDVIVNAANQSLLGGGGVDGAIHRAAGPELLKECKKLNGCKTGEAKITRGYNLSARYIIHTVGPVWRGGTHNEPQLLKSCYLSSLELAVKHECRSIAFPCINTGVYRYPSEAAAEIAVNSCKEFSAQNQYEIKIVFACFSENDLLIYNELLKKK